MKKSERWNELLFKGGESLERARDAMSRDWNPDGPLTEAIRHFSAAAALFPLWGQAYFERGKAHRLAAEIELARKGEPMPWFERALDDFTEATAILKSAETLVERGWTHGLIALRQARSGQRPGSAVERALEDLGRALEQDPRNVQVISRRATLYTLLGDAMATRGQAMPVLYERARSDWKELVRLVPDELDFVAELGVVEAKLALMLHGNSGDALAHVEAAVACLLSASDQQPADATLRFELGYAYLVVARLRGHDSNEAEAALELAVDAFNHAIESDPTHEESIFARGCARHLRAQVLSGVSRERTLARAIEDLSHAAAHSPDRACVRVWRARALAAAGRSAEARAELAAAKSLAPEDATISMDRARFLVETALGEQDYAEARKELDFARLHRPDDTEVLRLRGLAALARSTADPGATAADRLYHVNSAVIDLECAADRCPGDGDLSRSLATAAAFQVLLHCLAGGIVPATSHARLVRAVTKAERLGVADDELRGLSQAAIELFMENVERPAEDAEVLKASPARCAS